MTHLNTVQLTGIALVVTLLIGLVVADDQIIVPSASDKPSAPKACRAIVKEPIKKCITLTRNTFITPFGRQALDCVSLPRKNANERAISLEDAR